MNIEYKKIDLTAQKTFSYGNGYLAVYYPEHPFAFKNNGCIYYHRLVVEDFFGRYLKPEEHIHHLDNNPLNNDIVNLIVFQTNGDHIAFHKGGQLILHDDGTYTCIALGINKKRNKKGYFCGTCIDCGEPCEYSAKRCLKCYSIYKARNLPEKEELKKLLFEIPTTHIAKKYGVSDKAVEKWCKKYDLEKPPRGYWAKITAG